MAKTKRMTYIKNLFDNINGGDCVDSATIAQKIAEDLLASAKLAEKQLRYLWAQGEPTDNTVVSLNRAIAKAEGKRD